MQDWLVNILVFMAGATIAGISTFFATKSQLREYITRRTEELRKEIAAEIKELEKKNHAQELQIERLRSTDNSQQMAINGINQLWPLINKIIKKLDK